MQVPDKPGESCPECGEAYVYEINDEYTDEGAKFFKFNGPLHQRLYWRRQGHDVCDKTIASKKAEIENQERIERDQKLLADKFKNANVPFAVASKKTFDGFEITPQNERAFKSMSYWSPSDSYGLMLGGDPGLGKSHLFLAFAVKWIKEGHRVYFLNCSDMFDDLKAGYNDNTYQQKMDMLKQVDILMIDDLGAERPTEWVEEKLFQILNDRMNNERHTFFSTNCSLDEIGNKFHERVISRIREMAVVIPITGEDYRRKKYRSNANDLAKQISTNAE